MVSRFTSNEDLINAVLGSSHIIPFVSDPLPAFDFRGTLVNDGAFSDQLHCPEVMGKEEPAKCIKVSPFAGGVPAVVFGRLASACLPACCGYGARCVIP